MTSVYSVLFYDRLKQKPKHDGKLTVSRTENDHHVILESSEIHPAIVSYDDHGGDLTSDRENKSSMKKKSSHSKKSWDSCPPTGLLFSGKSPEISKKLLFSTALEIDDVITLSKWQCLIISIDSHSKSDFAVEHITKKTITHKTSIAHPLTIKKKLHSSNTDKMLLSSVNNGKEEAILFHGRKRKLIGDEMGSMIDESQLTERPIVIGPRFSSTDISFEIPHSIKSALRPHQVDGVMFLWKAITGSSTSLQNIWEKTPVDASKYSAGAILGDEMGSGKTLMTIALLCGLFRRNRKKRFIVVCPSSLVSNWAKEFDQWLGKAQQPKRSVVQEGGESCLQKLRSFLPIKPQLSEVLIISYELFRINVDLINRASEIGLLVVDEGHRLKNSSALTLNALSSLSCDARLLITGTPIQNNLSEFYTLVNFVLPGLLGSSNDFKRVFERPVVLGTDRNATDDQKRTAGIVLDDLDRITSTFMIRRAGQEFLGSLLPDRCELIIFCQLSDYQRTLYSALSKSCKYNDVSGDVLGIVMQLRLLCNHPALVDVHDTAVQVDIELSGKMSVLRDLLRNIRTRCPSDKIVIVSNFTSVLSFIERYILDVNGWSHLRLDGQTDVHKRQNIVDSFNRGDAESSFAFLLSAKAGGCGLNLTGGNRLVMIDAEWNPAIDNQAMARITRLGQTKPCFIYRFFSQGTVEEVILQRQMQKQKLAAVTIDDEDILNTVDSPFLTEADVDEIFELRSCDQSDSKAQFGQDSFGFDGAYSIRNQGCNDEPMLDTVTQSKHISNVHIASSSHTREA